MTMLKSLKSLSIAFASHSLSFDFITPECVYFVDLKFSNVNKLKWKYHWAAHLIFPPSLSISFHLGLFPLHDVLVKR